MNESAKPSKRELTARAIAASAQALADNHGLDGFTMDQLAEAAGVSRRTLFNYYPSKIDAILGTPPEHDPELISAVLTGGPSGHLMADLKDLTLSLLSGLDLEFDHMARYRRLLRNEPRIMQAAHARFEETSEQFAALITDHSGTDANPQAARIAVRLTIHLFDLALDAFLENPAEATLAEQFSRTYDTVKELLG